MDNKEVLKEKTDFFKTLATLSLGMSITLIVAYWSDINIPKIPIQGFVKASFWAFVSSVVNFFFYLHHYRKLILKLRAEDIRDNNKSSKHECLPTEVKAR